MKQALNSLLTFNQISLSAILDAPVSPREKAGAFRRILTLQHLPGKIAAISLRSFLPISRACYTLCMTASAPGWVRRGFAACFTLSA